jgi:hypothetical protein
MAIEVPRCGLTAMGEREVERMKAPMLPRWAAALLALGLVLVVFRCLPEAGAIRPMDQLRYGQDFVDQATAEIDGRVAAMHGQPYDAPSLFLHIRDLIAWVMDYDQNTVGDRYPLDGPEGLLVTDGIADTLATRLFPVLSDYVTHVEREDLGPGRQALEVAAANIPVPPGRFLGFHFQHMTFLYAAQADTILKVAPVEYDGGVYDGFLRRLWDIAQLYDQVHKSAAEKYFSRVTQEDWIAQRLRCAKCGHRGLRFQDQRMGLREDTTGVCKEILLSTDSSPEGIKAKFGCRAYGHVFDAVCPQCSTKIHFTVPLPYYRELQLQIALGGEVPDISPLIRKVGGDKGQNQNQGK